METDDGGDGARCGSPARTPGATGDALRPDVAKPLAAAQELYRAHKYRDALGKIAQAAAVPNRTPYETTVVEEMRGAAAMAAGDSGTAAQAYESVLNAGGSGDDEQRTTAALAGIYFQQKNYPLAIRVAQRYLKAGGSDPEMRTLLTQSYYLSNDCAPLVNQLKASTDAQANGGHAPDEGQLQMLATCAQKVKDGTAYRGALGLLVAYHPVPRVLGRNGHGHSRQPGICRRSTSTSTGCGGRRARSRPPTHTWK